MLKFSNTDVEAKYQSDFKNDPKVHVPAETGKSNGYAGPLSGILLEHAERLIKQESNLVTPKPIATGRPGIITPAAQDK